MLKRLFLVNTKVTLAGAEILFDSLKHNTHLSELDLSENDLKGSKIAKVQICLWTNRELRKLTLSKCQLGREAAQAIGLGLYKNHTLSSLNLSGNLLPNNCMHEWATSECRGLFTLHSLDLSDNPLMGD
jgi:hypothetical protein